MIGKSGKCCGCSACLSVCSKNAIKMEPDKEGFLRPTIDETMCVHCGLCERVCFYLSENIETKYPIDKQIFAAYQSYDDKELFQSSSGGAFIAISNFVLEQQGVVYGAVFNKNYEVIHMRAISLNERNQMCKSKYVQSDLQDCFRLIKKDINNGKKVLFTGTPCQCEGLKRYIGGHPDNLIICDFLCHGVPSPLIWQEYLKSIEKKFHEKVGSVNFRDKSKGWKTYSLIKTSTKEYHGHPVDDEFLVLFFKDLILRPECHECHFTSYERVSDITIADFWGIENIFPRYEINKGTSLLLGNTENGRKIIAELEIKGMLEYTTADKVQQPALKKPFPPHKDREKFWNEYINLGYDYVVKKYATLSMSMKVLRKVILPFAKKIKIYNWLEEIYYKLK